MDLEISAPPDIVEAFRDARRSGGWIHTYCPRCDPDHRKRGRLTLRAGIYRGKPWWGCMRCQCQKDWQAEKRSARLRAQIQPSNDKQKRVRVQREIERSSLVRSGDLVDRYLRETRSLRPSTGWWPSQLRTVTRLYHDLDRHDRLGGMIGVVQDVSGSVVACHRTYLAVVGGRVVKADHQDVPEKDRTSKVRLALAPVTGCAVRLGVDSDEIGVAEGIESALGLAMRTGLVCWAAISANGMRALLVPRHVQRVVIGPDIGDDNGDGLRAAYSLEAKLRRRLKVEVLLPPLRCKDWGEVGGLT